MNFEIKRKVNHIHLMISTILYALLLAIGSIANGFEALFELWLIMFIIIVSVTVWRMQSYKIVVDENICFKRVLFKDYILTFEEIKSLKYYDDTRETLFSLKRPFLEIDTKNSYFTYYLDHFDLEGILILLKDLEEAYKIPVEIYAHNQDNVVTE